LSKGMRATRVCSEQRTDLYETWHNSQGRFETSLGAGRVSLQNYCTADD